MAHKQQLRPSQGHREAVKRSTFRVYNRALRRQRDCVPFRRLRFERQLRAVVEDAVRLAETEQEWRKAQVLWD